MKKLLPAIKRMKFCFMALFLILCYSSLTPLSAQTITTFAGDAFQGFNGDGMQATATEFYYPIAVVIDTAGTVYIEDCYNQRIRTVNTSGIVTTIAGNGLAGYSGDGGPATAAEFNKPSGLRLDKTGNLYIGDFSNSCVRMVNNTGIVNTIAGNGTAGYSGDGGPATAAELAYPYQVYPDKNGNLFIADEGNDCVRMVNTSGIIYTVAGDSNFGFAGDGGPATAAELWQPSDMIKDTLGNLYIADFGNNRVRKVNTSGIISTIAGTGAAASSGDGGPATAASINGPYYLMFDSTGNLYVTDYFGSLVRFINTSGIISTVAGNGNYGYSGDGGPATAADLSGPSGLALDKQNNLYISDVWNNRTRVVGALPLSANSIVDNSATCIYPNPATDNITVQFGNTSGKTIVTMFNALGQQVYNTITENSNTLNIAVANFSAGIYLVKLQAEDGTLTTKKIEIAR